MKETLSSDQKRERKLSVRVYYCEATCSWEGSALTFVDNSTDLAPKRVTLKISSPYDVAYIRENLQKIEDAWRKDLEASKP